MAAQGKLEKMLILAFESAHDAENGSLSTAKATFEALINPETYTLEYKVKTADGQGQGTSGTQSKFEYTLPEELSFEFLFDNTGIINTGSIDQKPHTINRKPSKDGVFEEIQGFKQMLTAYQGSSHEPYHLKLVWGNLVFKGRAVELGITYKLFNPDGQPIRAVAKVKFKGSIEENRRIAQEARQSSDLTHLRKVKAGDTLPLMCHRIYGDSRHYAQVARANGLNNFRVLHPGSTLIFPPLDKLGNTP